MIEAEFDVVTVAMDHLDRSDHFNIRLEVNVPCTPRDILSKVYAYYQREVTQDLLDDLKDDDEVFGYVKDAQDAVDEGKTPPYESLMGDKRYFEGFTKMCDNVYSLSLGS